MGTEQSSTFKRAFFILLTFFSTILIVYILFWSYGMVRQTGYYSNSKSATLLKDCSHLDFEILSHSISYDSGYLLFTIVNSGIDPIRSIDLNTDLDNVSIDLNLEPKKMQELEVEIELDRLDFSLIPDNCGGKTKRFEIEE